MDDDIDDALLAFWKQLHKDQSSHIDRSLEDYQAQFVGIAGLLVDEWQHVKNPRVIGDRYWLRKLRGMGGQAQVWEAFDSKTYTSVAVRILNARGLDLEELGARLDREVRVLSKIEHVGICSILDRGEAAHEFWLVMPLINGRSLDEHIGKMAQDEALDVVTQIANAVQVVHDVGVVHRDIKPSNVLLDGDQPVLIDFGLARSVDVDATRLTATGARMISAAYASPEQWQNRPADHASDVWMLGVMTFELLTGELPFCKKDDQNLWKICDAVCHDWPKDMRSVGKQPISRDLAAVVEKCLEKVPAQRYPSASAFAADLVAAWHGRPVAARRAGPMRRTWLWMRREPKSAALATLVLLVSMAGSFVAGYSDVFAAGLAVREQAKIDALVEDAFVALGDTEFRTAIDRLEDVLDLAPSHVLAWSVIALSWRQLNDPQRGLDWLEAAPPYVRDSRPVRRVHADLLRVIGREEDHVVQSRELGDPVDELDWLIEAAILGSSKDKDGRRQAIGAYTQAIMLADGPRALYFFQRAHKAYQVGDKDVLQESREQLRAHGFDASKMGRFYLAEVCDGLGDSEGADELLTQLIEEFEGWLSPRILRGTIRAKAGRWADACLDYDAVIAAEKGTVALIMNRATCRQQLKDFAGALDDCTLALERASGDPWWILLKRSRCASRLRKWTQVITDCDKMVTAHQGGFDAAFLLGHAHLMLAHNAAAERAFSTAIQANPRNDEGWFYRGHVRRKRGARGLADKDLREALRLAPKSVRVLKELAYNSLARGAPEETVAFVKSATDLGTDESWVYAARAFAVATLPESSSEQLRGVLIDIAAAKQRGLDAPDLQKLRSEIEARLGK